MENLSVSTLWTVAVVFLGFQTVGISWRISREIKAAAIGEPTWLPWSDVVNLASMFVLIFGVFVFPTLGWASLSVAVRCFGLSLTLFTGYVIALIGHYNLMWAGGEKPRPHLTGQEAIGVAITCIATVTYVAIWLQKG